jgi:hypothetical protein
MPKQVGTKVYVHRDYLHTLPGWAQDIASFFHAHAKIRDLPPEAWNVLRVEKPHNRHGELVHENVALLLYHEFDEVEHPILLSSTKLYPYMVDGVSLIETKFTLFAGRKSPPILHRKELLVDDTHPEYKRWSEYTAALERAGLLGRPDIGTTGSWAEALEEAGQKIMFYSLVEVDDA